MTARLRSDCFPRLRSIRSILTCPNLPYPTLSYPNVRSITYPIVPAVLMVGGTLRLTASLSFNIGGTLCLLDKKVSMALTPGIAIAFAADIFLQVRATPDASSHAHGQANDRCNLCAAGTRFGVCAQPTLTSHPRLGAHRPWRHQPRAGTLQVRVAGLVDAYTGCITCALHGAVCMTAGTRACRFTPPPPSPCSQSALLRLTMDSTLAPRCT